MVKVTINFEFSNQNPIDESNTQLLQSSCADLISVWYEGSVQLVDSRKLELIFVASVDKFQTA